MKFIQSSIPEVLICEPNIYEDSRGYFFESFNQAEFKKNGLTVDFIQDNESFSSYGVLRGLHYQLNPYSQAKLVRVLEGKVMDVAVDIRKGSPTFGKHVSTILSNENKRQFFIPRGFAHGFVILSETAVFSYKCDNFYHPESDRGIKFDDKILNIDWKIDLDKVILSEKDNNHPSFELAEKNFIYGEK